MKPYSAYLFRFVVVMAIPIMLTGCAYIIKSSEIPLLQTGSPLKGISPKTFAFKEFRDIRWTDASLVGQLWASKIRLDQPAATVVATAIKKELERNGHTCLVDSPEVKANFVIEGIVFKYWFAIDKGFFSVKGTGNVAVKLTISAVSPNRGVLAKNYEGEYQLSRGGGLPIHIEEILNPALLAMIKEISTDPELIAFIEK